MLGSGCDEIEAVFAAVEGDRRSDRDDIDVESPAFEGEDAEARALRPPTTRELVVDSAHQSIE